MIRVALVERVARQAVKAHHQYIRLAAFTHPVLTHRGSQCADVARMVVEMPHQRDARQVAGFRGPRRHRIMGAGRGARRILRIERQHDDVVAALRLELVKAGGDRRVGVAHPDLDRHADALRVQEALQTQRLLRGMDFQRRALLGPDAGVFRRRFFRAHVEDDAVQDQPPHRLRNLDHARVRQELLQVAPHRGRGRGIGRAQVGDQNPGLWGSTVGERRFRRKAGHGERGGSAFGREQTAAMRSLTTQVLCDRAFDNSFAVISTIGITRSYAIRVGPITPRVPTILPLTS